MKRSSRTD